MKYKNIIDGYFLKRPNRFIAIVMVNGKEEYAHVKNTGRCKELLVEGAKVILEISNNSERKTKYSLIAVYKNDILINMDSQVPNTVVYEALQNKKIAGYEDITFLKREVKFFSSRFDIYYEKNEKKGFIEVKGVTLENGGIASFPDAPTQRGKKHVEELVKSIELGYEATLFFLVQMNKVFDFKLNFKTDEKFSAAVERAAEYGVNILVYLSEVNEGGIELGTVLPVKF